MRLVQVYTPPAVPTIPGARITLSVNQLVASAAWTKVDLDTVGYDTHSGFDAVNLRYVIPEDGRYLTCNNVNVLAIADGDLVQVRVYVNGLWVGSFTQSRVGSGGDAVITSNDIFNLVVGDYVEMWCYHNHAVARNVRGGRTQSTYLAVHKLS